MQEWSWLGPEAVRDNPYPEAKPSQSQKKRLIWKLAGLGVLAFGVSIWLHLNFNFFPATSRAEQTEQNPAPASSASPSAKSGPVTPDNLLGHLPYQEAPASDLVAVTPDGAVKLRSSAAAKYQDMVNAAAASGIYFAPISGFRSLEDQQHVFFDVKAERKQDVSKRAEVSAPPGYSEHHTGYAIDLGDGSSPEGRRKRIDVKIFHISPLSPFSTSPHSPHFPHSHSPHVPPLPRSWLNS